jgi:aspartyl-tRNA(Asn)/glutamyl-tRNA(Gln) amidotransferase subunit B
MSPSSSPISAVMLGTLVKRIEEGVISGKAAKEVLDYLLENGGDIDEVIEKLGLKQVSDTGALEALIDEILNANADKVAEYKSGKDKLFGFFVGQAMKASKGSANPNTLNEILQAKLAQ